MTATAHTDGSGRPLGLLDRNAILAAPGYNRWLVPPAALAIHLCIGMAYGFSVFWLPMSKLLPGAASCAGRGFIPELTASACNWTVADVTHIFETFIAMLGVSAALFGAWVERVGPRVSGLVSALAWGGGLVIGGYGVAVHQLWVVFLGCGLIGGIGQGLGYITPVSTLIRWFPDRRGMATGMAIMGYGGGAMIGSPLAVFLMARFSRGPVPGVAAALATLGVVYGLVMTLGAFGFRAPPTNRAEAVRPQPGKPMITERHVHLDVAWRTPQFWLIWGALCANVTAGIAVISMASPMLQEVFGGRLLGLPAGAALTTTQKGAVAAAAAGLVGLISLFNSLGRLFWAAVSDQIGRRATYVIFFVAGGALYAALPTLGHLGLAFAFVTAVCLILTMYGGGFAAIPAYLADMFGTQMVGAIHGRILTAWSVAGVAGPMLIAALRQAQLDHGTPRTLVYDNTLYLMAGLLGVGLVCNLLVRPVAEKHYMTPPPEGERPTPPKAAAAGPGSLGLLGLLAWLAVALPFAAGLFIALQKAAALF